MAVTVIAKGLLTLVLPSRFYNRSSGRTYSARYCYSVLLRHLTMLHKSGIERIPKTVAEIGPGASIGTGLAALIAGSERYYGFDIKAYGLGQEMLALFDDLTELFKARAPIPDTQEFPTIKPVLDDHGFPGQILSPAHLKKALAPKRLESLRARIASGVGSSPVRYVAPWFDRHHMRPGTVDWIFSQAVMEHVDDLASTYTSCWNWLRPGGVASHQIDFKSHGTAKTWNGHWAYSDFTWRMIRGGRLYLINRQPLSAHEAAIEQAGFEIAAIQPVIRADGLPRERLNPRFRVLPDSDLATAGAFILTRKKKA